MSIVCRTDENEKEREWRTDKPETERQRDWQKDKDRYG